MYFELLKSINVILKLTDQAYSRIIQVRRLSDVCVRFYSKSFFFDQVISFCDLSLNSLVLIWMYHAITKETVDEMAITNTSKKLK